MRRGITGACIALLLALVGGCGDSGTNPVGPGDYPDIENIIAFYSFDATVRDEVTGGHDAQSRPQAVPFVKDHNGTLERAIYVNGALDSLWIDDHEDLRIVGELTLAVWIKPDGTTSAFNAVVDKDYLVSYALGLHGVAPGDTLTDVRAFIGDEMFEVQDVVHVGTNKWTHIAFTFVDSSDVGSFYVDGNFVGSTVVPATLGISETDVRLGSSHFGDVYSGAIDQLAFFDRALTADEIGLLYGFD